MNSSWQGESGHLTCGWSKMGSAFVTTRAGCKKLPIRKVVICHRFQISPATVRLEGPIGSSLMALAAS